MYTIIIVFMFFAILLNCLAIISLTLCKTSQNKVIPNYELAQRYIDTLDNKFNWDYLLDYLAVHLVKYDCGKLPPLSMTLTAMSYDVSYKITFNDTLIKNVDAFKDEYCGYLEFSNEIDFSSCGENN